jgi:hypothetical protein
MVAQYPMLEHIISHLRPADLKRFAQICQTIHDTVNLSQATSKDNSLKRSLCPSVCLRMRRGAHEQPHYSDGLINISKCGDDDTGPCIESRPCIKCGVNTCDECRVRVDC